MQKALRPEVFRPSPTSLCSAVLSSGGGIHEGWDTVPGAAEGPVQGRSGRPGGEQLGVPVGPVDSGLMMLSRCALACLTVPSGSRTLTSTCELALGNVSEPSIRDVCEKDLSCTILFFNMYFFCLGQVFIAACGI